jgi:hypothetical protein
MPLQGDISITNPLDAIIARERVAEMRDHILKHPRWRRPGAPSPECAWGIYYERVVNRLTYRARAEKTDKGWQAFEVRPSDIT